MLLAAAVVAVVMALFSLYPRFEYFTMTGRWFPRVRVDTLHNAQAVVRWTKGGLVLADGRRVQLPSFTELPSKSEVLTALVSEGVEIDGSGRIIGLLRIRHTCGNEGWGKDVRRVDIADLMFYLGEGKTTRVHRRPEDKLPEYEHVHFSKYGLESSIYYHFSKFLATASRP